MKIYDIITEREEYMDWRKGSYGRVAELVPTKWLAKLKGNDLRYHHKMDMNIGFNPEKDDWDYGSEEEFINSIKQNAIQQPVMIVVGMDNGYAYIGEGNHRIDAAVRLGMDYVPARVYMQNEVSPVRGESQYSHDMSHDVMWDIEKVKAEHFPKEKYLESPSQVFKSLQGKTKK